MKAIAFALAGLGLAGAAAAQEAAGPDPDSREIHAKAREALARAVSLALVGEPLPLTGETRPIQGLGLAVKGTSQEIGGLLRDLNAEIRGREVRIALSADVLFDFDKAELKSGARPSLDKVVAVLKAYPKATATIEGHTDSKGDDNYNQKLSQRRAESVRKFLAAQGATLRMSTRGWGEKKPVAPNARPDGKDDPDGRQKNRRVEITVQQL
ncbi:MAG TPA: OmpA family protein [Usitatibacter sp.]|nr:OmpA family protein [Usitatibacter sp.]